MYCLRVLEVRSLKWVSWAKPRCSQDCLLLWMHSQRICSSFTPASRNQPTFLGFSSSVHVFKAGTIRVSPSSFCCLSASLSFCLLFSIYFVHSDNPGPFSHLKVSRLAALILSVVLIPLPSSIAYSKIMRTKTQMSFGGVKVGGCLPT